MKLPSRRLTGFVASCVEEITGAKPTDRDYRHITDLGKKIADNGWKELEGIQTPEIMMPYEQGVTIKPTR